MCPYNCAITCSDCCICLHMYSCDCPDVLIRASICKHIHLLVRFLASTSHTTPSSATVESKTNTAEVIQSIQIPEKLDNVHTCRKKIHDKLLILQKAVDTVTDTTTLQDVNKLLTSALSHTRIKQQSDIGKLPAFNQQPPNKHIVVQRPFQSTKRKRSRTNIRLSKPSCTDKTNILKLLLSSTEKQCPPFHQNTYSK